jgi:ornithine cyclodeaminase/alanine dehydrogenase-like protein (mu-crystallin family)
LQTALRRGDDLLLLTNEDVERVLTMADCVNVLRCFFEEEGKGQVLTRHRTESWLPHLTTDTFYQCKTVEGGVPYVDKYVIRIDSNVTRKKQQGQSSRVEHVPFGDGSWMGMLLVFSIETGELLGWMPDGYLQRTRVGALYAVAADYLARPGCRRSRADRLRLAGRRTNSRIVLRAEHQEGSRFQFQC